jgi:hypothetical protein
MIMMMTMMINYRFIYSFSDNLTNVKPVPEGELGCLSPVCEQVGGSIQTAPLRCLASLLLRLLVHSNRR